MGKHTFQSQTVAVGSSKVGFSAVLKGGLDAKARAEVLYETIGKPVEGVPEHLALPSAVIRYWMKHVSNDGGITAVELAALTASLLQDKESQTARQSKEARPNWLSLKMASRLATLQTMLLSTNLLNQCLANPVAPTSAARIYDGEFVHRFHHLQQRAKGMSALSDQLRKDGVKWEEFHKLYQQLAAGFEIKGEIVEQFEGGIMWGSSGPEGEAAGPAKAADKSDNALNNGVQAGGLFGGLIEDQDDDEEEEDTSSAPVPVAVDYSAAEKAAAEAAKKKQSQVDDDLAKLMADMESVDAKREEQAAKERARKNAQKKKK